MAENEQNDNGGSSIAKYAGIGFQMIAVIGIFTFAGVKIDEAANHSTKWVTALLSMAGVLVTIYLVIKSLKN